MTPTDILHAFTKLQALRRLNRAKSKAFEVALDDSLTKLAQYDAEPDSEQEALAFEAWLAQPLPASAYQ